MICVLGVIFHAYYTHTHTNYTLDWIKSKYKRETHTVDRKDKAQRSKLVPDKIESQQLLSRLD